MRTIEELRSTLAEQAGAVTDQPGLRVEPVHARVRAARRRRTAALAGVGVVALVVALGVLPGLRHREPSPADRTAPAQLAGRRVPATQTSSGFTYRYARGYQSARGSGVLDVAVPVGARPRLVMWASSDTDPRAVVTVRDRGTADLSETSGATGFGRYTYLPAGRGTVHLRVSQRDAGAGTRLALAVYDLSRTPPAGVSNGTVTYRQRVAGESLVRAVIGRRGQSDLTLSVTLPSRDVAIAPTCYGSRHWYALSVDGTVLGRECSTTADLDAGQGAQTWGDLLPRGAGPGDTVRVRLHLAPDSRRLGTVAQDPSSVLGLAVYTRTAPSHRVCGHAVPDVVDELGHTWTSEEWLTSDAAGATSLRATMSSSDRPRLLRWFACGLASGGSDELALEVSPDGRAPLQRVGDSGGALGPDASDSGYVVQPGATPTVVVDVPRGGTPTTRLTLVVAEQQH